MPSESRAKWQRVLVFIGRIVIGGVFISAAYEKLRPLPDLSWSMESLKISLAMFAASVDALRILPPWGGVGIPHTPIC